MSVGQIPSIVEAIGDRHLLNPVADWIGSKSWDGIDRLQEFYNTLIEREDYPRWLKGTTGTSLVDQRGGRCL